MTILVYLRFALAENANVDDFEGDMRAMAELAEDQLGHLWSNVSRSMHDPTEYLVASVWNSVDHVRRWEHDEAHEAIQHKWEPFFREPLVHQRFVPWERPPEP